MCNYKIEKLPIKLSKFYQQVLTSWRLIYKHNFSPQSFLIWNNVNILYRNKSLFFHNWFSNGLLLVNQLFNNEGNLFTFADFCSRYKIPITLKEFTVLTRAIPTGVHMLFKCSVYTSALSVCPPRPEHTSVGSICFSGLKPKNHQIRSLKCSFCECSSETISHLFWSCQYTQHFWNNVEVFIADNILKTFSLSYKHVILGYYIKDRSLKDVGFIINFILFLCKFHIHKCKFTKGKPLFMVLEKEIKMYIDVMSKSKNSKAIKTINICSSFNIFT